MTQEYIPASFYAKVYKANNLGRNLWNYLDDPTIIAKLIAATNAGNPAVAGIDTTDLLNRFDNHLIRQDLVKKMIGDMVGHIMMVGNEFEIEKQDVPFKSNLFSKGTCYRGRE